MNRSNDINQRFLDALQFGGEPMQKLSSLTSKLIKDGVREQSFLDEIIPLETLQKEDLDSRLEDDFPMKIGRIQVGATAATVNFRSKPDSKWYTGLKYPILFDKIVSPELKKSEAELMTIEYPITEDIEDLVIKDMARVRDEAFMTVTNAIIGSTGLTTNFTGDFGRAAIAAGLNLLEQTSKQPVGCILVNKSNWNKYNASVAAEESDAIVAEMVKTGYQSKTIMGYKIIVSNKDCIPDNHIYFFSPPDYLGENYCLLQPTFQVKKDMDIISMVCWGYYGCGIGNMRGVARVVLLP